MKSLIVHAEARAELDASIAFYESREKGLGLDFQAEVERALQVIRMNPEAWPTHKRSGFRKYPLKRFPFLVFYMDLPETIWIAAVAHGSRRPGYWRHRRLA